MKGPRSRKCQVCGKQTLLAGYQHHVLRCQDIHDKREGFIHQKSQFLPKVLIAIEDIPIKKNSQNILKYEVLSHIMEGKFKACLVQCEFCQRKFLPDRLVIHNRTCRIDRPARKVNSKNIEKNIMSCHIGHSLSNYLSVSTDNKPNPFQHTPTERSPNKRRIPMTNWKMKSNQLRRAVKLARFNASTTRNISYDHVLQKSAETREMSPGRSIRHQLPRILSAPSGYQRPTSTSRLFGFSPHKSHMRSTVGQTRGLR